MGSLWLLAGVCALVGGGASTTGLQAQEVIRSYDVDISVRAGGQMEVTERIVVRATGNRIKRGIYRDFPTTFPRRFGLASIEAPFDVISVTRDGTPEPYVLEGIGDGFRRGGVRVRIGRANRILDPGTYAYEIRYRTDRWIRFGDDADQFYWNVTGNGWAFPIESASARIRVEGLTSEPTLESWTGPEGSLTSAATATWDETTGEAAFVVDSPMGSRAGLTVRMTFPSGELPPPTTDQRSEWFHMDWGGYVDAGYLVLFVIGMYLLMWRRVGMDPAPGPVRLRTEPPEGYSPAQLGYIEGRGYDDNQLSAALVNMALKGAIRIEKRIERWKLHRLEPKEPPDLSPEEAALFRNLFRGRDTVDVSPGAHVMLIKAIKSFRDSLETRLEADYFVNNRAWFSAGLAISILGLAVLAWRWRFDINPVVLFLGFWLTVWTAGVATMVTRIVHHMRRARATRAPVERLAAVTLSLFALPFIIAEFVVTGIMVTMGPSHLMLAAFAVGATNVLFYHLLERPTLKGRGVLDHLAGFKAYMAGSDRPDSIPKTADRLAVFERFLPYAIATGLELQWATAFEGDLKALSSSSSSHSARSRPAHGMGASRPLGWYDGNARSFSAASLSSALGSGLGSTLSSASSPPSNSGRSGGGFSGGGGGGGSSGGGGGGGGGGGW